MSTEYKRQPVKVASIAAVVSNDDGADDMILLTESDFTSNLATSYDQIIDVLTQARLAWVNCDVSQVEPDLRQHLTMLVDHQPTNIAFHAPLDSGEPCVVFIDPDDQSRRHLYLHRWTNDDHGYDIELLPTKGDGYLYPLNDRGRRLSVQPSLF